MSLVREVCRNKLRDAFGNKGIRSQWKQIRIKVVGFKKWLQQRKSCDPRQRHNVEF